MNQSKIPKHCGCALVNLQNGPVRDVRASSHSLRITQIYCIFHLAIHNLYTAKHVHVFFQLDVVDGETNIKLNSDP
jgi:hypothetical protein